MLGPIFVREWRTLPRRPQHYAVRTAYLGLLWVLGITAWQAAIGWSRPATLGDVARFGLLLFQVSAFFQLTLLIFFSALSAAVSHLCGRLINRREAFWPHKDLTNSPCHPS